MLVGNFARELLVIDLVIVPTDALFGHSGGAAGFEDVEGPSFIFFGNPNLRLQVTQPFVLEMGEAGDDVGEGIDFPRRIPAGLFRPIEPEIGTAFGGEMPFNDFTHVSIELLLSGLNGSARDC